MSLVRESKIKEVMRKVSAKVINMNYEPSVSSVCFLKQMPVLKRHLDMDSDN